MKRRSFLSSIIALIAGLFVKPPIAPPESKRIFDEHYENFWTFTHDCSPKGQILFTGNLTVHSPRQLTVLYGRMK